MDESSIDTQESAWITSRNRVETHEDIILRSPRFSAIERFLVYGGGKPFDMYNRMMEKIFPKASYIPNILDDLKSKATANLEAIRTVKQLNGLFGLHDRIGNNTYKGVSDLVYWMNGSSDFHNIVEFPVSVDKLIHDGDKRKFNFFESMYPLNIRRDAENGLPSAFQFWNLAKTRKRFDELLDEFVFEYKDLSNNPEHTFDANKFSMVSMLKAIINLQRTILSLPEGIYDKKDFVDNTFLKISSMNKEKRNLILMRELKSILMDVYIPSEHIKSLFQKEINSESFVLEKEQYRKRKNLLICYRGIQFLLEKKFEMFINITIFQQVIFPTMKEMMMEEYLSDISNDMIVCLIRAGTVIIRSEIWKYFLCVRNSVITEKPDNMLKSGKAKSKKSKMNRSTKKNRWSISLKRLSTIMM